MAYAELAGLPPITGLYTSILCLVGYAVFGPSRVLVLGPDSSLGPMIAATIIPIVGANGDPQRAVALASMLALLVGVMTVLAGVAKLGFVADLLSKPTQIGYMNGLALTILVGQLPKLFGFSVDADGLIPEAAGFAKGWPTARRWRRRWPSACSAWSSSPRSSAGPVGPGRAGGVVVSILAAMPSTWPTTGSPWSASSPGFPPFTLPSVPMSDLALLVAGAVGIAVVSLTDTISTASAFAARAGQEVDGDWEMIGIGAANIGAGFFQGFPVSTSGSCTAVAEQAGAKSQVTGLVGALAITLMLLLAPGLLRNLPQPTLAAVVITASLSLADIPGTVRLWRQRRTEFALSMAAFAGVALLGVLPGIAIAVALSIGNVFRRVWWPYQTVLGRAAGVPGYHDVRSYPDAEQLPGCVLFRFDAGVSSQRPDLATRFEGHPVRAAPEVDRGGGRAHHRRRHHRRRHARGPRRSPQRPGDQPGLRRVEGSGPREDRAVRADPHHRPHALLSHRGRGRGRVPRAVRGRLGPHRRQAAQLTPVVKWTGAHISSLLGVSAGSKVCDTQGWRRRSALLLRPGTAAIMKGSTDGITVQAGQGLRPKPQGEAGHRGGQGRGQQA